MPVLICLRKKLWTRTYSTRDQVPTCPVFTRAKIKSRYGIKVNFCVTVCLRMYQHACLHIYRYFCCLLMGKVETKEESARQEEWVREREMLQSGFLFLTDFMVYFDLNMKRLFCGKFCWVMMIKIKIIMTLLFISSYFINLFFMWYGIYGQVIKMICFAYLLQ